MVSARIARILYVLYLLIILVVLLVEAVLFYVIGLLPTALPPNILFALNQTIILLYTPLIIVATSAYGGFFLFISGYVVSLVLAPEASVLDRLWLSVGLSLGLLVIIPLFISLFQSVFPGAPLINPYWAILIITACCFWSISKVKHSRR